jgi:hypothetical protein
MEVPIVDFLGLTSNWQFSGVYGAARQASRVRQDYDQAECVTPSSPAKNSAAAKRRLPHPVLRERCSTSKTDIHHDGKDLRPISLIGGLLQLTELVARSRVHCLHPRSAASMRAF